MKKTLKESMYRVIKQRADAIRDMLDDKDLSYSEWDLFLLALDSIAAEKEKGNS